MAQDFVRARELSDCSTFAGVPLVKYCCEICRPLVGICARFRSKKRKQSLRLSIPKAAVITDVRALASQRGKRLKPQQSV